MKKILFFGTLIMIIGFSAVFFNKGAIKINSEGNYIYDENFEDLENYADIVAIVKPTEKIEDREADITYFKDENGNGSKDIEQFWTNTNVKVKEVIKTNDDSINKGKEMIIREPFAIDNLKLFTLNDYEPLEKSKKYVVFLKKNKNGQYYITNVNDGKFDIEEEKGNNKKSQGKRHEKIQKEIEKNYEKQIKKASKEE